MSWGTKQHQVIYCDPPWSYGFNGQGAATKHYKTMTFEQLCEMPIDELAAKDCALLMWTTGPQMQQAIDLMRAWNFEYKTMFAVWVKSDPDAVDAHGDMSGRKCGFYTRQFSEFVLLGTRGKVSNFRIGNPFIANTFLEKSREHSRKPERIYEWIEKIFGPGIELFARSNSRPGWEFWGNETQKFK